MVYGDGLLPPFYRSFDRSSGFYLRGYLSADVCELQRLIITAAFDLGSSERGLQEEQIDQACVTQTEQINPAVAVAVVAAAVIRTCGLLSWANIF